jgi:hypothetical protein
MRDGSLAKAVVLMGALFGASVGLLVGTFLAIIAGWLAPDGLSATLAVIVLILSAIFGAGVGACVFGLLYALAFWTVSILKRLWARRF